ncbi:hypothetical protein [Lysobacter enzymogenes]|uniref:hypothetical protein n=1 Tax=Lysobacter enzymogenes TaxID=69 RepID=UPI0022647E36|nr:hypothetical protein [Lysobacter enzymogenes]UZW60643.1 hypothetical protein BV903_025910 [Lysobacter enzymogenes]
MLRRGAKEAKRDLETGLDPEGDDFELAGLRRHSGPGPRARRPLYPLLCGAVNLVRSRRLEWQDRKAASFVFSPLFADTSLCPIARPCRSVIASNCRSHSAAAKRYRARRWPRN